MRVLSLLVSFLRLRRLAGERRASMLVEFALILPGFFVILLGGLTVADALSAYNRMQNVSTTVGIMASRLKSLSNKDMVGISAAARAYMFPFPTEKLSILIAAVWVDDTGTPAIQWCERWNRRKNMGGPCSGNVVVGGEAFGYWETASNITINDLKLPPGILNPNTGIVVAFTTYDWNAPYFPVSKSQLYDFQMNDAFYYAPRADVTLTPPSRDRLSPAPTSSYNAEVRK